MAPSLAHEVFFEKQDRREHLKTVNAQQSAWRSVSVGALRWRLKLPLWIGEPAIEGKYHFRVAGVGHRELNRRKFCVPFIDLDAADVLFGPRLIVNPDVTIRMKEEQWFFPICA